MLQVLWQGWMPPATFPCGETLGLPGCSVSTSFLVTTFSACGPSYLHLNS